MDRIGNLISKIGTNSIIIAKGNDPKNTSFSVISELFRVFLIAKQEMPRGGVSRPISAPMTVIIPNQTRLNPMPSISIIKSGTPGYLSKRNETTHQIKSNQPGLPSNSKF